MYAIRSYYANGTIAAANPGSFANVEAGMMIQIGGSTANDRFYTVTGVSSDGTTLTVEPPPADETVAAGLDITVPSIQPGPMTVTGSDQNSRTYTRNNFV